jgi:hypothetical protein
MIMKLKEIFSCFVLLCYFRTCCCSARVVNEAITAKRPQKFILMPYPIFEDGLSGGPLFFLRSEHPQKSFHRLKRDDEQSGNKFNKIAELVYCT